MGKNSTNDTLKTMQKGIRDAAKKAGVDASELSKTDFWANYSGELTEWDFRKLGGFAKVQSMYFPKSVEDGALELASGASLVNKHRNDLERKYGTLKFVHQEMKQELTALLAKAQFKIHQPVKINKSSRKQSRTIVAHISDTHFGANIIKAEVGNVNEFNWKIAARRMALFAQQVVTYKPQHREDTELVLLINGDIIAGVIHNQEFFSDLLTVQFAGTVSILTQFISFVALHFGKVRVYCTPGNHGRAMHKAGKDRGTTHKWDSYENMIYLALKEITQAKLKNVSIEVPVSPFAIFEAQGHHYFVTHGDTVLNFGNPGKALNMHSIRNQVNSLNASTVGGSATFAAVIGGHHHTATAQLMDNGCYLVLNGCLSGADPFAQSIGFFASHPSQQLFEATRDHAVGDMRFVLLNPADNNAELDRIITPFVPQDR